MNLSAIICFKHASIQLRTGKQTKNFNIMPKLIPIMKIEYQNLD
ncbi:hypothetical protein PTD2_21977 [Pseudoalteromonas tunicata D2]|uniref:Uncharacterized protein n=1 Tax=Pseudoalteromonas tunicata D2 TaxID=87626 RepID=A4CAX1_9GAMM|nr:hypothetical protein PTD2_21977 [Pseudoalteromonas tunicata D2]